MPDYLQELLPTEPALMAELLQLFLDDSTASMNGLIEQMIVSDAVAIGRTLHTLKGSCSQIGACAMGRIIEEMEQRLRDCGTDAVCELLPELQKAFQFLLVEIEDWIFKEMGNPSRG